MVNISKLFVFFLSILFVTACSSHPIGQPHQLTPKAHSASATQSNLSLSELRKLSPLELRQLLANKPTYLGSSIVRIDSALLSSDKTAKMPEINLTEHLEAFSTQSLPSGTISVEILRDDKGKAQHLKLTGQHFMIYPKFSYALIDGNFGFGYQSEVTVDGQFETVVHVPDPSTFDQQAEHVIILATPFGVSFKGF